MRVLHVFFSSVINPQHKFLGTTKDIRGHTQYFVERGIHCEELILKVRKEKYFLEGLQGADLSRFDAVFVEGTYYPKTLRHITERYPKVKLILRGINAELFHWIHSAHAALLYDTWKRVIFDLKGSAWFGLSDFRCARLADFILPISAWEAEHYWRHFVPRDRVIAVPYFLPDSYLKDIPPVKEKKRGCVCMMTTKAGRPFLLDAAKNLFQLVEGLGGAEAGWRFFVTGDFDPKRLKPPDRVTVTGFLENPLELLAESRAVALLSDYGFGFKTKLLEAICCGCRLLVTKNLYRRLPPQVQRHSILVNVYSTDSFREALARCLEPPPEDDANASLRAEAFEALDKVFGL